MIPLAICDIYLINRIENIYPCLYWLDTGGADGPLPPMVQLVPTEKDVDPLIVFVKCTSLKALDITPHVARLGTGGFHRPIGTNDIIGTKRNGCSRKVFFLKSILIFLRKRNIQVMKSLALTTPTSCVLL